MLRQAFCCCYAITKELVNFDFAQGHIRKNLQVKLITKISIAVISIILLSILFLFTLPLVVFRSLVHLYLKIRFENFGGFLKGISPTCELEQEKLVIITVFMLKNEPKFYKKLQDITRKIHESNSMFSSFVESCLGYKFYLNKQVNYEDVISKKRLNDNKYIVRGELVDYLERYKVIGSLERKLWEVVLFEQPIIDENGQEKLVFMIRINHCVTDAYFMIALFEKYLRDDKQKRCGLMKREFAVPNIDDFFLNNNPLVQPMEEFLFYGSDQQYMSLFLENELNYIPRIKAIKDQVGVGFSDVLLAGLVDSVSNFLRKKLGTCSNKVNLMTTTRGRMEDMEKILNGTFDTNELANEFAILGFPVSTTRGTESAIRVVQDIHRTYKQAKLSVDAMLGYVCTKLQWQFFPTYLLKKVYDNLLKYFCLMSTNMSAVEKASIQGQEIFNIFSFVPLHVEKGIMMSTVTYDNRLHITLVAREKFLESRKELQDIMDGIFYFINRLENEVGNFTS